MSSFSVRSGDRRVTVGSIALLYSVLDRCSPWTYNSWINASLHRIVKTGLRIQLQAEESGKIYEACCRWETFRRAILADTLEERMVLGPRLVPVIAGEGPSAGPPVTGVSRVWPFKAGSSVAPGGHTHTDPPVSSGPRNHIFSCSLVTQGSGKHRNCTTQLVSPWRNPSSRARGCASQLSIRRPCLPHGPLPSLGPLLSSVWHSCHRMQTHLCHICFLSSPMAGAASRLSAQPPAQKGVKYAFTTWRN